MKMYMKHTAKLLICLLIVLFNSNSIGQVYKSTDEKGNVTFSDTPDTNADKIELSPPNTVKAVDVPPKLEVVTEETATVNSYTIDISSPADDGVIANGLVGFTVTTKISPELDKDHQLQLSIDGKIHSNSRGTFRVDSINRGPHSLKVTLIDEKGATLAQSSPVNIFAYRPSTARSKKGPK
ncbi:MAG: DUF4124 domain-containing protein [Oceanicoccus sp.]